MKEKIRIGIIGSGFARTVQIPAFQKIEGAQIVSVASGHLENAEKAARDFGIRHFTGDWRETVSRDDVDLICITTPPNLHYEQTLFALEHGKHILCEKYLVGENLTIYAELDTPNGKIKMQLVGCRYEQLEMHVSVASYLIGAKIVSMSQTDRALYAEYLQYGDNLKHA